MYELSDSLFMRREPIAEDSLERSLSRPDGSVSLFVTAPLEPLCQVQSKGDGPDHARDWSRCINRTPVGLRSLLDARGDVMD